MKERTHQGDEVNNGKLNMVDEILGVVCLLILMAICLYIAIFTNLVPIGY